METPELKPCPFCGSDRLRIFPSFVVCDKCAAMGPDRTGERSGIELWNTRAEVKAESRPSSVTSLCP